MNALPFHYLKPEDMRRLGRFDFAPRALVEGYFAGRHKSVFRGGGTDFRDYRPYVPGDDPTLIDWRVQARTDKLYVRTYDQETTMECHLFLDSSASMGFGPTFSKLEYASFFTAALAYLVVRNQDRVSLQLFDDGIRSYFPPGSSTRHLHHLLQALESNRPGRRTSVAAALRKSHPLLKRRGTLVVISDFWDSPSALFEALNPYLHRRFKIHLFQVLAPEELDLPHKGLLMFRDLETRERLIAHTEELRAAYGGAIREHIAALRELAHRRGVAFHSVDTTTHYFTLFDSLVK